MKAFKLRAAARRANEREDYEEASRLFDEASIAFYDLAIYAAAVSLAGSVVCLASLIVTAVGA